MKKSRYITFGILVIVLAFLLFWIGSIIFCEFTTLLHGDEFNDAMSEIRNVMNVDMLKVISYSNQSAKVYLYSNSGGVLVSFIKNSDGLWEEDEWEKSWSTTGSADDFIWPYIR